MKNFNLLAGVTALIAVASFVSYAEYRNTEKFKSLNEKYGELQMKLEHMNESLQKEKSVGGEFSSLIDADHFLFRRAVNRIIEEYVEVQEFKSLSVQMERFAGAPTDSAEHLYGNRDAEIQLFLFSDFSCPYCAKLFPKLIEYAARSNGRISLILRHFPLKMHGKRAVEQAMFMECIAKVGNNRMFWLAASIMYEGSQEREITEVLKLNENEIKKCRTDQNTAIPVIKDVRDGESLEINSTPTVVIFDRLLNVRSSISSISSVQDITREIARIRVSMDRGSELKEK